MLWNAYAFDGARWFVKVDAQIEGVAELVGAKWHRGQQAYAFSPRQLEDAELLVDAGFVGFAQSPRHYAELEFEAYHPGLDVVAYSREEALEIAESIGFAKPPPVSKRQLVLAIA